MEKAESIRYYVELRRWVDGIGYSYKIDEDPATYGKYPENTYTAQDVADDIAQMFAIGTTKDDYVGKNTQVVVYIYDEDADERTDCASAWASDHIFIGD